MAGVDSCKQTTCPEISNIRRTIFQNLNDPHLVLHCLCQIHWSHVASREWRCVWNFGTASTGDAPTTSEWSTILFTTKVQLILEVWWYSFILRKLSTLYSLIWVYMLVDNSPFCLIWILFKSICFLQAKKIGKKYEFSTKNLSFLSCFGTLFTCLFVV